MLKERSAFHEVASLAFNLPAKVKAVCQEKSLPSLVNVDDESGQKIGWYLLGIFGYGLTFISLTPILAFLVAPVAHVVENLAIITLRLPPFSLLSEWFRHKKSVDAGVDHILVTDYTHGIVEANNVQQLKFLDWLQQRLLPTYQDDEIIKFDSHSSSAWFLRSLFGFLNSNSFWASVFKLAIVAAAVIAIGVSAPVFPLPFLVGLNALVSNAFASLGGGVLVTSILQAGIAGVVGAGLSGVVGVSVSKLSAAFSAEADNRAGGGVAWDDDVLLGQNSIRSLSSTELSSEKSAGGCLSCFSRLFFLKKNNDGKQPSTSNSKNNDKSNKTERQDRGCFSALSGFFSWRSKHGSQSPRLDSTSSHVGIDEITRLSLGGNI
jgi:hypothetical protein